MEYLAAYIYFQKTGNQCRLWDPTHVLENTLRNHPQVRYLKELSDETVPVQVDSFKTFLANMKFKDIQKIAADILYYNPAFNQVVVGTIQKAGFKDIFDIGIHLVRDISGPNLSAFKTYSDLLKTYQAKSKKKSLSVYIMADNYSLITQFQNYCDPSWNIMSLSKIPVVNQNDAFIQNMANIQILTALPALILDFSIPEDRYVYLMQRYKGGLTYFAEVKNREWNLI